MRTRTPQKQRNVKTHTASASLTASNFEGFHTNLGAAADVTLTLPKAREIKGMRGVFMRSNVSYALILNPNGSEQFVGADGVADAAGLYNSLATDGAMCIIESDGTYLYITCSRGTITTETP